MPVVKGKIGYKIVDVQRDTGCSGIVVKRELVLEEQYTGNFNCMLLVDKTSRQSDSSWQEACAVTTRSQARKDGKQTPLKVASSSKSAIVDRNELVRLQRKDESLEKYWDQRDIKVKGE